MSWIQIYYLNCSKLQKQNKEDACVRVPGAEHDSLFGEKSVVNLHGEGSGRTDKSHSDTDCHPLPTQICRTLERLSARDAIM